MLSIGKLTPGRAAYYVDQLPAGQDEYYTGGDHPEAGVWLGRAASRLGLAGPVAADGFRLLLDARHPTTREPLGVPRTTAGRLAGFDLCFSAPKSVSLAWALGPCDAADAVAAAHDRAVAQAIDAFEAEVVRARRGAAGHDSVETDGVAAAAFAHRTSRAGDPQLHTHVVVANLTPDASGRWTALDGARVYRWAKTLGYLYQAALRAELSDTLGMTWGPVRHGAADLAGVDRPIVEAFSQRTAQIDAVTGGPGTVPLALAKTATLATRPAKADLPDLDTLRHEWAHRATHLGLDPDALFAPTSRLNTPDTADLLATLLGPHGLTAHGSSFDRRDVLQALSAAHPAGAAVARLRADADTVLAHPDIVALAADRPAGPRYSTAQLLAIEQRLLDRATRPRPHPLGVATPVTVQAALAARPTLTDEQCRMVETFTTSGAAIDVVVGRAGTGKTFALDAARAAWETSGHRVIGAALAARAAAELQAGAGIPATTIDRLLADLDRPGPLAGLPPRTVVVIDEAAMIGTRKLARLLDHAHTHDAKVVLVGDHRQLPEIDAGGAFAALAHHLPAIELVDNRRQTHAWERRALAELRAGSVPAAFNAYTQAGRVTLAPTADAARAALVADWWHAHQDGQHAVMYALRRDDVDDLNRLARAHLHAAGDLGADRISLGAHEFAIGDRVLCGRNDRRLGVRNGTTSTVTALDPITGAVTLADGTRLPADYVADHLGHAYAMTIHKAQGATVDRAFLLGSAGLYREAGYVGLSRARHGSDLYLVAPAATNRDATERDPVIDTIRRLGQSQAQQLASEQLHHATEQSAQRSLGDHPERHRVALADPAPWMIDALGEPPLHGLHRDRWARHAERLAAYRDIYTITDSTDALGPRPDDPTQRRAWDLARLTIDEHHRTLELDQGLQR